MTDWIKHDSTGPPALAPAALVEVIDNYGDDFGPDRVNSFRWKHISHYCSLTDPEGIQYCSAEGLEPWCKYVATSYGWWGHQYQNKPKPDDEGEWWVTRGRMGPLAPDTHIHPGHWKGSLMRVWRG